MGKLRPWIMGLIILGVVVLVAAILWVWMSNTMMQPSQTSADQFLDMQIGDTISVVGEIIAVEGQTITVEILEGEDYDRRSGTLLELERTGEENIVMGGETDLMPGAIAQFDGTKTASEIIRLERTVILTGFVKGPPPR